MEISEYCSSVQAELVGWKSKLDGIVHKFDETMSGDKTKVVPYINELHMMIEDFSDRIDKLQNECPTSWRSENIGGEGTKNELH